MWSETKKIGLGPAVLVLFCETRSCHARRHNDLEGHGNFQGTIYSFSIRAWNISTVKINSGVHLIKSQICEVPLFTSGGLGLDILVLVL